MDLPETPEFSSNPHAARDLYLGSVAWCFLPIGLGQIGQCSRGFRDFFDLDDSFTFDSPIAGSSLEEAFRKRGIPLVLLLPQDTSEHGGESTHEEIVSSNGFSITSEAVFDDSGLPTGRMLVFEKTPAPNLPDETVERLQEARRRLSKLSARETEILGLVYEGLTNKAIGIRSKISAKTVEKHRSNIMHKLGIQNSSQLIRCVSEARLCAELSQDNPLRHA